MTRNEERPVTLTVRIPQELHVAFKIRAAKEQRSMDAILNELIGAYVRRKEVPTT